MVYTWNELVQKEGNRFFAKKAVLKGKYKKISHGIYVDEGEYISELEQLFVQYPRATLTMQSAFDYYEMSDYVPDKYYLATPYNSHTIRNKKVFQSYMSDNIIDIGREKVKTEYGYIYIYDKERMLIELFRLKNKLPRAYFLEVVKSYRSLKEAGVLSSYKLSDYAKHFKNGLGILKTIQEVI